MELKVEATTDSESDTDIDVESSSDETDDGWAAPVRNLLKRSTCYNQIKWWNTSYIVDYCTFLILIFLVALFRWGLATNESLEIGIDDSAYWHSERSSTVPTIQLFIVTIPYVIVFMIIMQFWARSFLEFHHLLLSLFQSFLLTTWIYSFAVKVGEPRPTYLTNCDPIPDSTGRWVHSCQKEVAEDEFNSFISGHIMYPLAVFICIDMWIVGKTRPWRSGGLWFIVVLLLMPMPFWTFYIGFTRINDHRHHSHNVVYGALLGILCGVAGYLFNFHNPFGKRAGDPRLRQGTKRNPGPTNVLEYFIGPYVKEKGGKMKRAGWFDFIPKVNKV